MSLNNESFYCKKLDIDILTITYTRNKKSVSIKIDHKNNDLKCF